MQGDPIDRVAVLYCSDFFKFADRKFGFFLVFSYQGDLRGFTGLQATAGKFPEIGPYPG